MRQVSRAGVLLPRIRRSIRAITLVEVVVGAAVLALALSLIYSFLVLGASGTGKATESSDALRSILVASEYVRRDVLRMRYQDPAHDIVIDRNGRGLGVAVPRPQTDDFWNTHHDPVQYWLEPVEATGAHRLVRSEKGKSSPIAACYLKDMLVRHVPPGAVSAFQGYLEVTLVGLGRPGGTYTYTASFLLPLTQMVLPDVYSVKEVGHK